jgi:PAS domain S-box-containing protein
MGRKQIIHEEFSSEDSKFSSIRNSRSFEGDMYELLGHTMDYISDAFFSLNCSWEIIYVNKKGCELVNRSYEELVGNNMWELFPHRIGQEPYNQFYKAMETKLPCNFESYFEEGQLWFEHKAVPTAEGLSIFVQNITERKLAEKKLNEQMTLLEKSNKQLSDFCNIVSHNLRSPLFNMSILVDFIESSKEIEEQLTLISKMKPVLNSLNETFNELVESLQVRQNSDVLIENLRFDDIFKKVIKNFQPRIDIFGLDLKIDFSEVESVDFSRKYLESIFMNLISNSFKYKSPESILSINIKTYFKNNSILFIYKDNGIGIDMDKFGNQLFKLGKVFHSHPNAKGFGLFMTKDQIESLGGRIWAESKPNKGTAFFIEFKAKL